jgi:hypothetical protein
VGLLGRTHRSCHRASESPLECCLYAGHCTDLPGTAQGGSGIGEDAAQPTGDPAETLPSPPEELTKRLGLGQGTVPRREIGGPLGQGLLLDDLRNRLLVSGVVGSGSNSVCSRCRYKYSRTTAALTKASSVSSSRSSTRASSWSTWGAGTRWCTSISNRYYGLIGVPSSFVTRSARRRSVNRRAWRACLMTSPNCCGMIIIL